MRIFRLLSVLLDYPGDGVLAALAELAGNDARTLVETTPGAELLPPEDRRAVADFVTRLVARDPLEAQGAYVQTFDLTAEHSLHLTHHLFGEEKTRGPALIDLGEFYRSHGLVVDERELPDYLPAMLEFASELTVEEMRVFLSDVGKILKVLADNLEKSGSCYAPLVRVVENQASLARLAAA